MDLVIGDIEVIHNPFCYSILQYFKSLLVKIAKGYFTVVGICSYILSINHSIIDNTISQQKKWCIIQQKVLGIKHQRGEMTKTCSRAKKGIYHYKITVFFSIGLKQVTHYVSFQWSLLYHRMTYKHFIHKECCCLIKAYYQTGHNPQGLSHIGSSLVMFQHPSIHVIQSDMSSNQVIYCIVFALFQKDVSQTEQEAEILTRDRSSIDKDTKIEQFFV